MIDEIRKVHLSKVCEREFVLKEFFSQIFMNTREEVRKEIDYIITLGGDGTILWASKQFRRCHFPPLISFAHGFLYYMCNFEFEEHPHIFEQVFSDQECNLHLDNTIV